MAYEQAKKKGQRLEDLYFDNMRGTLGKGGMPQDQADEASASLIYPNATSTGRDYLNLPMYESLKEIPIKDQMRKMMDRQKELPSEVRPENENYMPPLNVGERYASRGPSSVPTQDVQSDDEVGRITDIEAANSISPREKRGISNAKGDMLVGASHALLGLLSGNHNRAAMEYGKANQYVSGQRKQDIADLSKLVKTVGPDGKPIYTPTVEAADMLAYEAPKGGSGGAAGSFQLAQMYDPDSNRYFTVRHNSRTGEMLDMSGTPITPPPNAIVRPTPPKIFQAEDVGGTKMAKEYNPYKPQSPVKTVNSEAGLGPTYGVKTKGQAEAIEKGYGKAQEEYQNLSGALVDAKTARQSLDRTQDPRVLAESVYSMVRAVESKGVLTDQDFENITGMKYMSWYRNMDNMLKTKAYGDIEQLRNSFKGLADKIQSKIQARVDSIPERFAPETKEGQRGLKSVVPGMSEKGKKNASKKVWGSKYGF